MHENDSKPLTYAEFAVDPSIAEWIVCGWSFEANESLHRPYVHHVVPDGCVSLVYRTALGSRVGQLIIAGPRTQSMQVAIEAGDRYWGFRFWPDTAKICLGVEPRSLRNRSEWMPSQVPYDVNPLAEKLRHCVDAQGAFAAFKDFLRKRDAFAIPPIAAVRSCLIEINRCDGTGPLGEITGGFGLSQRQMQRKFQNLVGLTPKEYARVRRLRVALAKAVDTRTQDWVNIALDTGFSDQSHFSREAAAMTGLSPMQFEARIRQIEHRNIDP
jgi:AraC-like DNA-binding protein